ncbi:MAG: LamG domain-containing protein [Candidatus Latescibacteria bacterium]|nr:LamG domain-containing protein [Candidatus Latescibacterota bacterium]
MADVREGLIGHWPFNGDCRDHSGNGHDGQNHGVSFTADGAAFDGKASQIEVHPSFRLGPGDFSISVRAHTDERLDDIPGDLLSQYDPVTRTGFSFGIQSLAGVTSAQSNDRHLHFGIDAGRIDPAWTGCGRPGNNLFVCALAVYEGQLYAGTFEHGANEVGHLYRYAGGTRWIDCGSPDPSNAITALAVYNGKLYAGTSCYKSSGSALPDSPNLIPGGKIYRYEGGKEWTDCGKLTGPSVSQVVNPDYMQRFTGWNPDEVDGIHGMAVYDGALYVIPMYHQGLFRYEGGTAWTDCGSPGVRLMSLTVFNGHLYAAGNDGNKHGGVYRYDGKSWTRTGDQPGVTQVYSFATYEGKLYVGTWPEATVFRYDGGETWTNCGRLGQELEVMGMAVYNGKLYAGTLPLAEVYRYDGGTAWTRTGQLDTTPDVRYRRAWSMAVFQGSLFCGTLPSGHVHSLEAGKSVTYDHELKPGWRHLVAVRHGDRLKLYVDGRLAATSSPFNPADYDLSNDSPLRIGFGAHDHFNGKIRDLRLYSRALTDAEVSALHRLPE